VLVLGNSGVSVFALQFEGSGKDQVDMARAVEAARLKSVIDRTFALSDIAAAFRPRRRPPLWAGYASRPNESRRLRKADSGSLSVRPVTS
jgi:hypothetical protein